MKISTTTDEFAAGETVKAFTGGEKIFNRYKLERVLGQGGMGVVWLAQDEELDRPVAIKFLPSIFINDRASLNELKRETRRSLELTHPHIVRTYDFVQDSTTAGISMEYVDSDTLRNRRLDQPGAVFEPEQLGNWMRQLCSALDYAHLQAAIVHRDLKPANLMVNCRDQLKVADFGISRSLVESVSVMSVQRGISGTLVYMSPQQLSGEMSTPSDDIYAVGATIYELLTTRPPFFTGDVAGQVRSKVPESIAERRRSLGVRAGEIPLNWETTVANCLAKEAVDRPRSAGEVAVQLGLIAAADITVRSKDEPPVEVPAPAPPPLPSPGPASGWRTAVPQVGAWSARKKQVVAAGLAAVVLLAIGGVFAVQSSQRRAEETRLRQIAEQKVRDENEIKAAAEKARSEAARLANLRGTLALRTIPTFAKIKVGDRALQEASAPLGDLALGKYPVQIIAEGYEPETRSVEVKEGANDLGLVTLVRSVGPLKITSEPPGLVCEVSGKQSPLEVRKTPIDLPDYPAGEYNVTVKRDGWPDDTRPITVEKGPAKEAHFRFLGSTVNFTSTPQAEVRRGAEKLGSTPLELKDQPPGAVQYTLSKAGYEDVIVDAEIKAGQPHAFDKALVKKGKPAPVVASRSSRSSGGSSTVSRRAPTQSSSSSSGRKQNTTGEALKRMFVPGYDQYRRLRNGE